MLIVVECDFCMQTEPAWCIAQNRNALSQKEMQVFSFRLFRSVRSCSPCVCAFLLWQTIKLYNFSLENWFRSIRTNSFCLPSNSFSFYSLVFVHENRTKTIVSYFFGISLLIVLLEGSNRDHQTKWPPTRSANERNRTVYECRQNGETVTRKARERDRRKTQADNQQQWVIW